MVRTCTTPRDVTHAYAILVRKCKKKILLVKPTRRFGDNRKMFHSAAAGANVVH
jgi:hypothetical protein